MTAKKFSPLTRSNRVSEKDIKEKSPLGGVDGNIIRLRGPGGFFFTVFAKRFFPKVFLQKRKMRFTV